MKENNITYKTCTACRNTLPETSKYFSTNHKGRNGLKSQCKVCSNIKNDIKRRYHREQDPHLKPTESEYKRYLRMMYTSYRLREKDLRDYMDFQKGCCAICKDSLVNPIFSKSHMHVDHDHTTGVVRALLCGKCNWLVGVAREDLQILINSMQYLLEYEALKQKGGGR